jgi:hypothetical protein
MATDSMTKTFLARAAAFTVSLATLLGVIYGFGLYVDSRVEHALRDESFLRRLSARVRPSLIFNEKGAILVDSGALEYITEIKTTITEKDFDLPGKILVRPKQYLAHAPLLSSIDNYVLEYTAERASGLDWEFTVKNYVGQSIDPKFKTCRYRLEILY